MTASRAEVTFLTPNTRVNSNHLPLGELKSVSVYRHFYDNKGNDERTSPEPTEDELPEKASDEQKPHRRGAWGRAKVGEATGDDLRNGRVDVDVEPGLQYLTLVATDTDGRDSEPSAPFRLLVRDDSAEPILRDEDAPNEPHVVVPAVAGGHDPDRPSLVTKVNARLL